MIGWFRKPRITLLVLCSANICRSPAAEGLLRDALKRLGLHRRVQVLSAGTEVGVPGVPPDPRMVAIGAERGIRLRGLRSKALTAELLATADAVYGMEQTHLDAALSLMDGDEAGPELMLIDPQGLPIGDPYFGDKAGVRRAFEHLARVAEQRAGEWQQRLASTGRLDG